MELGGFTDIIAIANTPQKKQLFDLFSILETTVESTVDRGILGAAFAISGEH